MTEREYDEAEVRAVSDAICGALASWMEEPLHLMAYDDAARAAISVLLTLADRKANN